MATYEDAVEMIRRHEHDVYLLDYHLGKHNGLDLLREAMVHGCQAPIILLTGQGEQGVDVEAMYRSVIDNIKEVIFQIDPTGLWTFLNPAWAEITGFSIAESLGANFLDYIHPDDRQRNQELCQYLLERDQAYCRHETRFLNKDNGFRWLEVYAQLTLATNGTILGVSGTLNDITDRKRAEAALRASETRFRTLTTHAPVGILQNDSQGSCVFVNKRACELIGITAAETMGSGWTHALHPEDRERIFAEWNATVRLGQDFSLEYRFQTPEGKITWVLGNATPLRDEAGEIAGYLGTITDITERKQTELLERDRNDVLEMVAQNQPLKATLTELVHLIERQRSEMLGSILLIRDGRVYHSAAPSLPDNFIRAVDGLAIAQILGTRRLITYEGETAIMSDIANILPWNEYYELALNHGYHACWSTPVFSSEGAMLGTVTMYYRQPASPENSDLQLIRMASRLAAIAIEQWQLADQLTYQAKHDALTGLPNRLLFRDCLQEAIAHARQHKQLAGLLYIDLDRFKMINDTLGHAAGDRLLFQFTQGLQACIRPSDTLARIGGDEFTLVLPKIENPQGATRVAQRILEALQEPFLVIGHEVVMTASIGISFYPTDGDSTEEILRKADQALYRSKESGKNTYQFYNPVGERAA